MTGGPAPRGQPAAALVVILLGWTVARMIVLNGEPISRRAQGPSQHGARAQAAGQGEGGATAALPVWAAESMMLRTGGSRRAARPPRTRSGAPPAEIHRQGAPPAALPAAVGSAAVRAVPPAVPQAPGPGSAFLGEAGSKPVPMAGAVSPADHSWPVALGAPSLVGDGAGARASADSIGGDLWLVIRAASASAAVPRYGDSQLGGVVRVPLGRAGAVRASGYLRAGTALRLPGAELAAGLGLRSAGGLPVQLTAEVRAQRDGERLVVKPALGLATSLSVRGLPRRLSLAAYAQTGWVGGPGRTAYAEGVVRLDRVRSPYTDAGPRVGLGIWAAGQRGAQRLDAGPAISLPLPDRAGLGLRLEASWRQRLAGNAAPGSGPAILLAASF